MSWEDVAEVRELTQHINQLADMAEADPWKTVIGMLRFVRDKGGDPMEILEGQEDTQ